MGLEMINILKKAKGLTNEQLASESGLPLSTIAKITSGATKDPKFETLKAIARVLDCSIGVFDDIRRDDLILFMEASEHYEQLMQTISQYVFLGYSSDSRKMWDAFKKNSPETYEKINSIPDTAPEKDKVDVENMVKGFPLQIMKVFYLEMHNAIVDSLFAVLDDTQKFVEKSDKP